MLIFRIDFYHKMKETDRAQGLAQSTSASTGSEFTSPTPTCQVGTVHAYNPSTQTVETGNPCLARACWLDRLARLTNSRFIERPWDGKVENDQGRYQHPSGLHIHKNTHTNIHLHVHQHIYKYPYTDAYMPHLQMETTVRITCFSSHLYYYLLLSKASLKSNVYKS